MEQGGIEQGSEIVMDYLVETGTRRWVRQFKFCQNARPISSPKEWPKGDPAVCALACTQTVGPLPRKQVPPPGGACKAS
jgi:hypothetical protein